LLFREQFLPIIFIYRHFQFRFIQQDVCRFHEIAALGQSFIYSKLILYQLHTENRLSPFCFVMLSGYFKLALPLGLA